MILNSNVYKIFKWVLCIVLPAFLTLFSFLCSTWNWDIPVENIIGTITAVATFLGVILGISNYNYYKEDKE